MGRVMVLLVVPRRILGFRLEGGSYLGCSEVGLRSRRVRSCLNDCLLVHSLSFAVVVVRFGEPAQ